MISRNAKTKARNTNGWEGTGASPVGSEVTSSKTRGWWRGEWGDAILPVSQEIYTHFTPEISKIMCFSTSGEIVQKDRGIRKATASEKKKKKKKKNFSVSKCKYQNRSYTVAEPASPSRPQSPITPEQPGRAKKEKRD